MSNLSQEEIDALLNGGASSDEIIMEAKPTGEVDISEIFGSAHEMQATADTQNRDEPYINEEMDRVEQIEKMLEKLDKSGEYLSHEEKDLLGEMGNICMGASATTMYTLIGRRVTITTPQVHVYSSSEVLSIYKTPFVVVTVEYSRGVEGKNLLILKEDDSAIITDLLMGGDGNISAGDIELDDIHMSAMSEIMNQMIGSAATSLSNMLGTAIDITPPSAKRVGIDTDVSDLLDGSQLVIKVCFDMEIEGLLKSKLMQLMTIETGKKLASAFLSGENAPKGAASVGGKEGMLKSEKRPVSPSDIGPEKYDVNRNRTKTDEEARPVKVKPYNYEAFDEGEKDTSAPVESPIIELISDIPLQVAVELGKTKKSINDILNMGIGSVIVLDKMAGEQVEVVVNGKQIARGEVVVIDENYGVRITDILMSHENVYI